MRRGMERMEVLSSRAAPNVLLHGRGQRGDPAAVALEGALENKLLRHDGDLRFNRLRVSVEARERDSWKFKVLVGGCRRELHCVGEKP